MSEEGKWMFLSDYHIHSSFSYDSRQTVAQIAQAAMEKGMEEIAITDHVELAAPKLRGGKAELREAVKEIEQVGACFQGKLIIRKGMELGNANLEPEEATDWCGKFSGDFIIGSVHNLEPGQDVAYYDYSKVNARMLFHDYLDAVANIAGTLDYDVLGHITYPLKAICEQTGEVLDMRRYRGQFRRIFEAVAGRGKGIEVNTSGLRYRLGRLLPDRELLELYRSCGGVHITVGSDAHRPEDVGEGIAQAAECLRALGWREITVYQGRQPIPRPILRSTMREASSGTAPESPGERL